MERKGEFEQFSGSLYPSARYGPEVGGSLGDLASLNKLLEVIIVPNKD